MSLLYVDRVQSNHAENFLRHCAMNNYDDNCIVRYIPRFILQTGDKTNTGRTSEPADTKNAFSGPKDNTWRPLAISIDRGTIMMINNKEHTVGSQFFIVLSDKNSSALKDSKEYTPIGKVVGSLEALDKVEASDGLASDNLKKNGKIKGHWKESPWIKAVEVTYNPYA